MATATSRGGISVTHRVKLDINNWARQVYEILDNSKSKIVLKNKAGVSVGLGLLISRLIKIAERAIELYCGCCSGKTHP